eukprot:355296-Chlamydomonas_euryale.AAC.3
METEPREQTQRGACLLLEIVQKAGVARSGRNRGRPAAPQYPRGGGYRERTQLGFACCVHPAPSPQTNHGLTPLPSPLQSISAARRKRCVQAAPASNQMLLRHR